MAKPFIPSLGMEAQHALFLTAGFDMQGRASF
jgi:hypothetical protein